MWGARKAARHLSLTHPQLHLRAGLTVAAVQEQPHLSLPLTWLLFVFSGLVREPTMLAQHESA